MLIRREDEALEYAINKMTAGDCLLHIVHDKHAQSVNLTKNLLGL